MSAMATHNRESKSISAAPILRFVPIGKFDDLAIVRGIPSACIEIGERSVEIGRALGFAQEREFRAGLRGGLAVTSGEDDRETRTLLADRPRQIEPVL